MQCAVPTSNSLCNLVPKLGHDVNAKLPSSRPKTEAEAEVADGAVSHIDQP